MAFLVTVLKLLVDNIPPLYYAINLINGIRVKILTYALVSAWSSVSSRWEHVKRKMHPCFHEGLALAFVTCKIALSLRQLHFDIFESRISVCIYQIRKKCICLNIYQFVIWNILFHQQMSHISTAFAEVKSVANIRLRVKICWSKYFGLTDKSPSSVPFRPLHLVTS